MRTLPVVILLVVMLVAVVTGCGGARYDGRLVAADSLIANGCSDSALATLEALPTADLTTDGDRAYHGLLLAQARYKSYITATSDSDINRALTYYRTHSDEREKLTRAYIYKGAVMEELGHPDSAMLYYKHAEATAAPDDYFNQGYSKLRIAELYQDQISQDSAAIDRLKEALKYFEMLNDTNYLIVCYGDLGAICGTRYPDSTEYYFLQAIDLAQRFNPIKQYTYKSKLAGFNFYYKKDYACAKSLSMDVLMNGADYCAEHQFYYYAILSYIKLGLNDSAKYVLSKTSKPVNAVDSMNRYDVLAELALAEDNLVEYSLYHAKSKELLSQITFNSKEKELVKTDVDFLRQQARVGESRAKHHSSILCTVLAIAGILLIILALTILMQKRKIRNKELETAATESELREIISSLNAQLQQKSNINDSVKAMMKNRIDALNELINSIRFRLDEGNKRKKKIVTLSGLLSGFSENFVKTEIELSDSFWNKIHMSVDGEYDGIATFVHSKYPELTTKEFRMFCLFCADISPQIIKLCMNFTNVRTATNYRSIIIKKKLGLNMTFDEFVDKYLAGELK